MPIRFTQAGLLVIFIAGLLLSYGGYLLSLSFKEKAVQQEQRRATVIVANALNTRVKVNIDTLKGIRGLFLASEKVSAKEFSVFSQVFLETRTDIKALEWIPRVTGKQRLEYEQQAQTSGFDDFRIRERDGNGNMHIAGQRDEYFPIFYMHPLKGNEKALGFDLASNSTRLAAIQASKKSKKMIATRPVQLVQETDSQKGYLVFMPVFLSEKFIPGGNDSSKLSGFALGVFLINNLFDYALEGLEEEIEDLSLSLIDSTDPLNPELMYGALPELNAKWQQKHVIKVAGRHWEVISTASKDYIDNREDLTPYWVFAGGVILSLILTLYLRTLTQCNIQTYKLVQQRTKDLLNSESRSALIVNEAADAVITIDSHGRITTFNPAAEKMFQYSANEVTGKNVNILMPEPYHSEHDAYLEKHKSTGEKHIIGIGREVTGKRKSGRTFPLHLSVGKGVIDDRPIFIGILSDMTQRKEAEASLIEARDMAEEANRQKSIFLNMMSHELRTPLTVLLGYLPVLKDKDNMPSPEMIAEIVSDMDLSGQHLLDLINDLLDISKIEAGQMDLHREYINARLLIDETVRKFQNHIQQSQIKLILNVTDVDLYVDIKRFKQIVINLLGNALKFTHSGTINIEAYVKDSMVVFEFKDTGTGIPAKDLPHIFEAFKQADSTSTRAAGGSGLGLAITKKLVELHGGEITASSNIGSGSTFKFTIKQQE